VTRIRILLALGGMLCPLTFWTEENSCCTWQEHIQDLMLAHTIKEQCRNLTGSYRYRSRSTEPNYLLLLRICQTQRLFWSILLPQLRSINCCRHLPPGNLRQGHPMIVCSAPKLFLYSF
jgi:hypothetical protein